jgi:type IV pilus assembly protein PilN
MRNIESSQYLGNPGLVEVKAVNVARRRVSEFNLNFRLKRQQAPQAQDAGKPAAKPEAKKG